MNEQIPTFITIVPTMDNKDLLYWDRELRGKLNRLHLASELWERSIAFPDEMLAVIHPAEVLPRMNQVIQYTERCIKAIDEELRKRMAE